jgi:hypothetical protein
MFNKEYHSKLLVLECSNKILIERIDVLQSFILKIQNEDIVLKKSSILPFISDERLVYFLLGSVIVLSVSLFVFFISNNHTTTEVWSESYIDTIVKDASTNTETAAAAVTNVFGITEEKFVDTVTIINKAVYNSSTENLFFEIYTQVRDLTVETVFFLNRENNMCYNEYITALIERELINSPRASFSDVKFDIVFHAYSLGGENVSTILMHTAPYLG